MTPVLISSIARCAALASRSSTIACTRPAASRTMRPSPAGSGTFAVSTARWPASASRTSAASASGGHERDVADRHERHAVAGQRVQRDARGVAGAARRILQHEREVGRGERRAHRVGAVADDHRDGPRRERRAPRRSRSETTGRPASGCSTLGSAECIRLPWPAARTTTLSGEVTGSRCAETVDDTPASGPDQAAGNVRGRDGAWRTVVCGRVVRVRPQMLQFCVIATTLPAPDGSAEEPRARQEETDAPPCALAIGVPTAAATSTTAVAAEAKAKK